jgi:hypothetical protein
MNCIENYCEFFSSLTSDFDDELFEQYFASDSLFQDPFQHVQGRKKIIAVFRHMFKTLENPRFVIKESLLNENSGYIRWEFFYNSKSFEGMSHVVFDENALVTSHIDYWDAASNVYEHIPILGSLLRLIKTKIIASS